MGEGREWRKEEGKGRKAREEDREGRSVDITVEVLCEGKKWGL